MLGKCESCNSYSDFGRLTESPLQISPVGL